MKAAQAESDLPDTIVQVELVDLPDKTDPSELLVQPDKAVRIVADPLDKAVLSAPPDTVGLPDKAVLLDKDFVSGRSAARHRHHSAVETVLPAQARKA